MPGCIIIFRLFGLAQLGHAIVMIPDRLRRMDVNPNPFPLSTRIGASSTNSSTSSDWARSRPRTLFSNCCPWYPPFVVPIDQAVFFIFVQVFRLKPFFFSTSNSVKSSFFSRFFVHDCFLARSFPILSPLPRSDIQTVIPNMPLTKTDWFDIAKAQTGRSSRRICLAMGTVVLIKVVFVSFNDDDDDDDKGATMATR